MASKKRKIGLIFALVIAALGLAVVGVLVAANYPRPASAPSEAGDLLAKRMHQAIAIDRWDATGAVRFRMDAKRPLIVWDRTRGFAHLTYDADTPPLTVLLHVASKTAIAMRGTTAVDAEELAPLVETAVSDFVNDSFWLNAPSKAFDDGTSRTVLKSFDEKKLANGGGLLVAYETGGVTPGDAYLWELDANGRPVAWRMWVRILPIGGVRVTWDGWTQLATGAWVAQDHSGPLGLKVHFEPLEGAETLGALVGGDDPFAPLVAKLQKAATAKATVAPASQPAVAAAVPAIDAGPSAPADAGASAP